MRRDEIVQGLGEVIAALTESHVYDALRTMIDLSRIRENTREPSISALRSLKRYALRAQAFSQPARETVNLLGLEPLEDPSIWVQALSSKEDLQEIWGLYQTTSFALEQLPKLVTLFNSEAATIRSRLAQAGAPDVNEVLSVVLIENERQLSRPTRLADLFTSVELLYETCATLHHAPPHDLAVIGCDSGSDKSFDFLGAAKVVQCVKELIVDLWDRVVFYRERQIEQRIELVAQSLPILETIGKSEQDGHISPEQAEILRRNIIEGTTTFLSCGALIPEIKDVSSYNPRVLMAPTQKLITSKSTVERPAEGAESFAVDQLAEIPLAHARGRRGKQSIRQQEVNMEPQDAGLTGDEIVQLRQLMKKVARAAGEEADEEAMS